jgi:hypothetical protein
MSDLYKGSPVEETLKYFDSFNGTQKGDPEKAAARIFEVVTGTGMAKDLDRNYLRLLLGKDCLDRSETKLEKLRENLDAVREISLSTDLHA